jgi:asparagine synthase (glutamine-hydrolysing)
LLHAYSRWGEEAPEHLEGQFSFVIVDRRAARVFASVDHLGSLPLLYRSNGRAAVFAGDMPTMLGTEGCPRELNAAALLTFSCFDAPCEHPEQSLHMGICALPPGHSLILDARGVTLRRYWALQLRPELVPGNESDVYEKARALVEDAVAHRLEGKERVALMFSGGLDSSVLAAASASYLRKRGKTLLALGAVADPANGHVRDERRFMEKLRCLDNVELQYVDAAGRGPFDSIDASQSFQSSARLPVLRYLFEEIRHHAEAGGADILLNGTGGEIGLTGTPAARFLEDAVGLRWRKLARNLSAVASVRCISPARLFAGEAKAYYSRPGAEPAFFLQKSFAEEGPTTRRTGNPLWPDSAEAQLRQFHRAQQRHAIAATLPPDLVLGCSRPLRDKNLLEYCVAVPSRFKMGDGFGRFLARRAFSSALPADLVWRQGKVWASADYNWRYNAQVGRAAAFVSAIRKSDPVREIVDVERLAKAIRPLPKTFLRPDHPLADGHSISKIPETINLINFLRQFSSFRG